MMLAKTSAEQQGVIEQGWYSGAKRVPSPNCDDRPEGTSISLLVIHNISLPPGCFGNGYIEQFFQNKLPVAEHPFFTEIQHLQVSAHCLITREGEVVQFVPFQKRAWHAGKSLFDGRENCNDFSIGVELEGTDTSPYTSEQYKALAELTRILQAAFPSVSVGRIVGHSTIAPGRKTDPGEAFDWLYFRSLLK